MGDTPLARSPSQEGVGPGARGGRSMKTDAVRWTMENGGLRTGRMCAFPSTCQPYDSEGLLEPVTETFLLAASDGSQFLVTITKVKHEPKG